MSVDRTRSISQQARAIPDPEARREFLDEACGSDSRLRTEVERTLNLSDTEIEIHFEDDFPSETAGDVIGPYRLIRELGHGGFGTVWLAEQKEPIERTVALKVIKLGMDTKQVVARFEQERQALALMNHPHVARVLDAGATATGRPYFVMDLVDGQPISGFCDRFKLTIRERLELFQQVCQAIQHAHSKGIIHRDLKPSNVLVGFADGKPHATVIDFGIAKATSGKLTDRTLVTGQEQIIGTFQYMSPEQAAGSQDIDTRTDVYSLGVLLYEVLTGAPPFDRGTMRSAMFSEVQRLICEVEPPRPSDRVSSSEDTLVELAASRRVEPNRLSSLLRGELDWLVMKAIDKDRARRYETASSFALDIQRFLSGQEIVAAPPSAAYRLRKFVRRNRSLVGAATAVLLSLILGAIAFAWQAHRAKQERDLAVQARNAEAKQRRLADERATQIEKISSFQASMLEQIDVADAGEGLFTSLRKKHTLALGGSEIPKEDREERSAGFAAELMRVNATDSAAELIHETILSPAVLAVESQFEDQPVVVARLRQSLATIYARLGRYDDASKLQDSALELRTRHLGPADLDTLRSHNDLGHLLEKQGKFSEAETHYRAAYEGRVALLGEEHPDTIMAKGNLGGNLRFQARYEAAEPYLRSAYELSKRVLGPTHRSTLVRANVLGYWFVDQSRVAEAEPLWREAHELGKATFGVEDDDVLVWTNNYGGLLATLGRSKEAEQFYREAWEGARKRHGEEHPNTLSCASNVVISLQAQARYAEAEPILVRNLEIRTKTLGPTHPDTLGSRQSLAIHLRNQGKFEAAESHLRVVCEKMESIFGKEHLETIRSSCILASLLARMNKAEEAESRFRAALATPTRILGAESTDRLVAMNNLAGLLITVKRSAEAVELMEVAVERRRQHFGEDHPETCIALSTLGRALADQGKHEEAVAMHETAAAGFRRRLGFEHPNTSSALANAAEALLNLDRPVLSEAKFREALDSAQKKHGPNSILTAPSRMGVSRALKAQKKFGEAEAEILAVVGNYEADPSNSADRVRSTLERLVELYEAWQAADPGADLTAQIAAAKARFPQK